MSVFFNTRFYTFETADPHYNHFSLSSLAREYIGKAFFYFFPSSFRLLRFFFSLLASKPAAWLLIPNPSRLSFTSIFNLFSTIFNHLFTLYFAKLFSSSFFPNPLSNIHVLHNTTLPNQPDQLQTVLPLSLLRRFTGFLYFVFFSLSKLSTRFLYISLRLHPVPCIS